MWSGVDEADYDMNISLHKYGIDSMAATNMKIRIQNHIGAIFESYYFVQPKTSGLTIINDIMAQIDVLIAMKRQTENKDHSDRAVNDIENSVEIAEVEISQISKEKVIALYSPDEVVVNVFMIHGSHKSALSLASFALGFEDQSYVSLYGIGMDENLFETSDYGNVKDLAKSYIRLIKSIQRLGPYYLAGYSFGGTVAYEMASQLKRNNETVLMLLMVDTYAWFPNSLLYAKDFFYNQAEGNLKNAMEIVVRQLIEGFAYTSLGVTKNQVHDLYESFEDYHAIIGALEDMAAERNVEFFLRKNVDTVLYELRSAKDAHLEWQPAKVWWKVSSCINLKCHSIIS
ncbi:non-reducing polyketide synthase PKS16-like [Xenia sp. Carnegie-2017]|uniref:non-reducing polyketide synthase PKS16-like n=1 Tax=Xenia sp. Carnegie-2017 TaxID=2897299 RepID=UPI001F04A514|nr:non-reducing polyketide synthase PKS16-like [Xenia sp. Carnegie-2017]